MASEPEPVAVIGPLKATRMLLDGSAVLVRREEWERLQALLAERDAEIARLREALELELQDEINAILKGGSALTAAKGQAYIDQSPYVQRLRAALAARGGEADAA